MRLIKVVVVKKSKNWLGSQNIKNLAKLKSLKNFIKCKKNLVKFKISEESSFLNSSTRLAYN